MSWSYVVARLICAIGSWLDASNLRNRVYQLQEENEVLHTALADVQRMDPEGRIGWYAKSVLDLVDQKRE